MRPTVLVAALARMRHELQSASPLLGATIIQLEVEKIAILVSRSGRAWRRLKDVRNACSAYRGTGHTERDFQRRKLEGLIQKLEEALIDATPSETAKRLGVPWSE